MEFNALVLFIDYVCMFTPIALTTVLSFLLSCSFSLLDWGMRRSEIETQIYIRKATRICTLDALQPAKQYSSQFKSL